MSANESVPYSADGGIAIITINRPEVHNAMNTAVREGLVAAFERVEADDRRG